jgi:hypothetical protein
MPPVIVEHLSEPQLAEARAMVELGGGSPQGWDAEAAALIRRGGGVLAARAPDGALHGLASYEIVERRGAGRELAVGRLIAFELNRRQPVRNELVGALQRISEARGCTSVTGAVALSRAARTCGRDGSASPSR